MLRIVCIYYILHPICCIYVYTQQKKKEMKKGSNDLHNLWTGTIQKFTTLFCRIYFSFSTYFFLISYFLLFSYFHFVWRYTTFNKIIFLFHNMIFVHLITSLQFLYIYVFVVYFFILYNTTKKTKKKTQKINMFI